MKSYAHTFHFGVVQGDNNFSTENGVEKLYVFLFIVSLYEISVSLKHVLKLLKTPYKCTILGLNLGLLNDLFWHEPQFPPKYSQLSKTRYVWGAVPSIGFQAKPSSSNRNRSVVRPEGGGGVMRYTIRIPRNPKWWSLFTGTKRQTAVTTYILSRKLLPFALRSRVNSLIPVV